MAINVNPLFSSPSMPNGYFRFQQSYTNDKLLMKSVITEAYNMFAVPCDFFVVSYDTNYDKIFGEDDNRTIERKFDIQAFFDLPKEEDLFTKFGIEGIDNFHVYISMEHFREASTHSASATSQDLSATSGAYPEYAPKAGDILRSKHNNYYYEVVISKKSEGQFLMDQHVWDLIVSPMKDEHHNVSATTLSGDDINNYINHPDEFNIAETINQEVTGFQYTPEVGEKAPQDPFNNWYNKDS